MDATKLMDRADRAMYLAKRGAKNRVEIYREEDFEPGV
jgi:PleD family two-component response regulator